MKKQMPNVVRVFLVCLLMPILALAQDIMPAEDAFEAPKREYSPFVDDHFPIRPLFGDTHLHTSWSAYDAVRYNTEMRDDVLMTTTERAYTSPIWYTP